MQGVVTLIGGAERLRRLVVVAVKEHGSEYAGTAGPLWPLFSAAQRIKNQAAFVR